MVEEILAHARANPKIDPFLSIWGAEISAYLFLGGLTAGIMVFAAAVIILRKEEAAPFTALRLPLLGVILLSLGMLMLFLDLERKLYVWRFYTTFQPSSPMSWGSWILILVYPALILMVLAYLRPGFPRLATWIESLPYAGPLARLTFDLAWTFRRSAAWLSLGLGIALGIYTGILLSAFNARPFWNTGLLGPLFLVSGLSTGAAVAVLGGRKSAEGHLFTRIDIGLIVFEMALVALLLINLWTGTRIQHDAVRNLFGGDYTMVFWLGFVALGLVLPLLLESVSLVWNRAWLTVLPPLLILAGGYLLRDITVDLGQRTAWVQYQDQFDAKLVDLVRHK